ncbi:hypothetical protein CCP3SC1AL1_1380006 [Gammaproteobacteria bacterium]
MDYLYGYVDLSSYITRVEVDNTSDPLDTFKRFICLTIYNKYNVDISNNPFIRFLDLKENPMTYKEGDFYFESILHYGSKEIQIIVYHLSTSKGYLYNKNIKKPVFNFFFRNVGPRFCFFPEEASTSSESIITTSPSIKSNIRTPMHSTELLIELKKVLNARNLKQSNKYAESTGKPS